MAEAKTEDANRRLNDLVAITVVVLTVFMGVSKVKDDNIVQAMQKAKADAVDAWSEYQSARMKLHLDENGLSTLHLLDSIGIVDKALVAKLKAEYETDIAKYERRSEETMAKAKFYESEYDRLNFHDDQFDISDAFLSLALALAAVAALVDTLWLLYTAWGAGSIGVLSGLAGFFNLNFRMGWVAQLLGT